MSVHLTERAKQLIPKAKIINFALWKKEGFERVRDIFQKAEDEGRYLSDRDLEQIQTYFPQNSSTLAAVKLLGDRSSEIVDRAREELLSRYPDITLPGGELYPPERAEACWRDLWQFLRCITYGIAARVPEFADAEGLQNMQLLYRELRVPLAAMVFGLENLKFFALRLFSLSEREALDPYFEHLIGEMKRFG